MEPYIEINGRKIGPGYPAYIIAEMSANHNHDFDRAVEMIKVAKRMQADAVKLQTYTPDTLTIRVENENFRIKGGTLWDGRYLYDLYADAYMPWEWQPKLKEVADDQEIDLFSTAYDYSSVDFLEQVGIPLYKVASFELVDPSLLKRIAETGRPVVLSTGMATLGEIDDAMQTLVEAGANEIALLKCNSAYPAPVEEMNLKTIPHLAQTYNLPVGLSDHTLGIAAPVTAVVLGASIIEKHFTLSRDMLGPDSVFSLEPDEFQEMVKAIRVAESALGRVFYGTSQHEGKSKLFRRSLFVVLNMMAGETFSMSNVRSIRPGNGLPPKYLDQVIGRRSAREIPLGTPVSWDLIGD